MKSALLESGIDIDQGGDENIIDLINCHATSTPKGDYSEADCILNLIK